MIGTHNSLTYLKPIHWWGYLAIPFAKCQTKTLFQQYLAGARCFDIRVKFDKIGKLKIAHGFMQVQIPSLYYEPTWLWLVDELLCLAKYHDKRENNPIYYRIILEDMIGDSKQEENFITFCNFIELHIQKEIPSVRFLGGNRKKDWKQVYTFKNPDESINQWVSSMADNARWYEKICPWLYAKRCNKHNLNKNTEDTINLYDFL